MKKFPTKFFNFVLDLLYPPRCFCCRRFLRGGGEICPSCEQLWPSLVPPFCPVCAHPFLPLPDQDLSHLCGECLKEPRLCRRVWATGIYRGILHDLIVRMKYRGEEWLSHYLARRMGELPRENPFDLIVPIPLFRDRLRERGFNQSVLLARRLGAILKVEADPFVLIKKRSTPVQTHLTGEERRKNLRGVFAVKDPDKIDGKRILVVDDVYTTGATIEAASRTLLKAGASTVEAMVAARAE